jgi:hypothetical protein
MVPARLLFCAAGQVNRSYAAPHPMWSNVVILTAIVAPLVLVGAWLFLRHVDRTTEREAAELAAKCNCPACGELTLKWNGELWGEQVLYDDREDDFSGYVLTCSRCSGKFQFTAAGKVHVPATSAA